jgi:uncharacterized membrane protein YccC
MFDSENLAVNKNRIFITPQDYSLKTLKANLNLDSVAFRHSLRISFAVLLSFVFGYLTNPAYTNWIIVTAIVILRPTYGLTKSRAFSRMWGTIFGGIAMMALILISQNRTLIGISSGISVILGFSYIQKNYKAASAYITFSILGLYVLNHFEPFELVYNRVGYTVAGVAISIFSVYFLWPVWEKVNIKTEVAQAITSNRKYLQAVNKIYAEKSSINTEYRLIRKEAFLKNGNLTSSFQRMQDEPKSKRNLSNNIYALVLLNQTLLSAVASYSSYIQAHTTTMPSKEFDSIMNQILKNLQIASENLHENTTLSNEISDNQINEWFKILEQKNTELNEERNKELESGILTLNVEMRAKLQEAKIILEQLRWFYNLSVNMKSMATVL